MTLRGLLNVLSGLSLLSGFQPPRALPSGGFGDVLLRDAGYLQEAESDLA